MLLQNIAKLRLTLCLSKIRTEMAVLPANITSREVCFSAAVSKTK